MPYTPVLSGLAVYYPLLGIQTERLYLRAAQMVLKFECIMICFFYDILLVSMEFNYLIKFILFLLFSDVLTSDCTVRSVNGAFRFIVNISAPLRSTPPPTIGGS